MSFGSVLKGITSHIPVVGEVAGPLLGAALGAAHGGGWKGALKGALGLGGAALTAATLAKNASGAGADSKRAHELADQSAAMARQASAGANQRYGRNASLRDAFRFGALNFGDPSNPFDRSNQFARFRAGLTPESTAPAGAVPPGGLGSALKVAAAPAATKAKGPNTAMLQAATAGNE